MQVICIGFEKTVSTLRGVRDLLVQDPLGSQISIAVIDAGQASIAQLSFNSTDTDRPWLITEFKTGGEHGLVLGPIVSCLLLERPETRTIYLKENCYLTEEDHEALLGVHGEAPLNRFEIIAYSDVRWPSLVYTRLISQVANQTVEREYGMRWSGTVPSPRSAAQRKGPHNTAAFFRLAARYWHVLDPALRGTLEDRFQVTTHPDDSVSLTL